MIIYLVWVSPFQSSIMNGIEVMNEITVMLLLYLILSFTDWIESASDRYFFAWFFIGFTCANLLAHLFVLLTASCSGAHVKMKFCIVRRKAKFSKTNKYKISGKDAKNQQKGD